MHQSELAQFCSENTPEDNKHNPRPGKDIQMSRITEPAALPADMPESKTWVQELESFAEEFKKEIVPPAPKASLGVGPVKYHAKFSSVEGVNEKRVKVLDDIIQFEESLGKHWIKIEAMLIATMYGREDPIKWLPAAQRYTIRCELYVMTAKLASSNGLARGSVLDTSTLMNVIRMCSPSETHANAAELSLIAGFIPKPTASLTPDGPVLVNEMDEELSMEHFAKLVDGMRKQQAKVDLLYRFIFRLLHRPEAEEDSIPRKKIPTSDQSPTEGNLKDRTTFSIAEIDGISKK
ncbi:hypothetical protein WAI453_007590 [Rhynchosporium graminicola]